MLAALAHLGEQHRRHRRHVGGLRSRNAGHQEHGTKQHMDSPAADMANKGNKERNHHPGDAGHLISRPRKTNIGTDSSNRFDMPSSIRLTTTDSGVSVVSAR